MPDDDELDPDFEALLGFLHESRGVDFAGYKRTSLRRLVARRMHAAGASDVRAYLDRLEVDASEVRTLFDSLLINVTAFFRDPAVWEALRERIVPDLLERLGPDEPLRVWSAACASGEEAYSLAILLHSLLGDEAYRSRVKIYATDLDEPALASARAGRYAAKALETLTDAQREEYFVTDDGVHVFRADLRQNMVFGRHDLLADAPISRVSLLLCRNVLMYFTADTQARILERFAFALHEKGVLVLGKAEMLLTHSDLFAPLDLTQRTFRSTRRPHVGRFGAFGPAALARQAMRRQVTEAAFAGAPDAQIVLDVELRVALVNDMAVRELGVRRDDVGRTFADLELSYRPAELRAAVERVLAGGQTESLPDVHWSPTGQPDRWWDVQIAALRGPAEALGVTVAFLEVTRYHQLTSELVRAHADLQQAYEELQSSSEELETTNEELQSAIEELETTNEELQSTNEELETMNEELQSTNEELQTVNDELRDRTGEVSEVNAFLESVLAGLRTAVTVVDTDLRVLVWSAQCERLWGLRSYEVEGQPIAGLDGGVPGDRLEVCARQVLATGGATVPDGVVAVNRLGRRILLTTTGSPLHDRAGGVRGAILTMDEDALEDGVSQP